MKRAQAILSTFIGGLLLVFSSLSHGAMKIQYMNEPCADGGVGVSASGNTCALQDNYNPGLSLYGPGSTYGGGHSNLSVSVGFSNSYVPKSGNYHLKFYWCEKSPCTTDTAVLQLTSSNAAFITSGQILTSQDIQFNFPLTTLVHSGMFCWTFIRDETGVEYSTEANRTCQDAPKLPNSPAACILNNTLPLNVGFGDLERSGIPTTVPTIGRERKSITVQCEGTAASNVEMTVEYTSSSINGSQLVSTSTPSLGVAIIYNGELITPSDRISLVYQQGASDLELSFEAVKALGVNIKSGNFLGNAVLIMTEQ